jgi:hypothetical protein
LTMGVALREAEQGSTTMTVLIIGRRPAADTEVYAGPQRYK